MARVSKPRRPFFPTDRLHYGRHKQGQPQEATRLTILSSSVRQRICLYLGALIVLLAFGGPYGGLIDIPISFFLKNKLHLNPHEVAEFRLVAAFPLYFS